MSVLVISNRVHECISLQFTTDYSSMGTKTGNLDYDRKPMTEVIGTQPMPRPCVMMHGFIHLSTVYSLLECPLLVGGALGMGAGGCLQVTLPRNNKQQEAH